MEIRERAGQRFYIVDGRELVSVTTALQVLRKPWLEQWRGNLGNAEADRVRDETAGIGTKLHRVCHLFNSSQEFVFPSSQIEQMFGAYHTWFRATVQEVLATELVVWSQVYGYAGTLDILAILNGASTPAIIDLKTSSDFSKENALQLAAYRHAWLEQQQKKDDPAIYAWSLPVRRLVVRIDRVEHGYPVVKEYTEHAADFNAFVCALGLWRWMNK